MEYIYEIIQVRNSRFPSFFFITLAEGNRTKKELVRTIQESWSQTLLTGEKPDGVSEFLHAKLCLVLVTKFLTNLSKEDRDEIFQKTDDEVKVGTLSVMNVGDFELVLNNKDEKIYLAEAKTS